MFGGNRFGQSSPPRALPTGSGFMKVFQGNTTQNLETDKNVWEQFRLPIPPHTIPTHHIALYQPALVACVCSATIQQKTKTTLKTNALVLFKETGVWRQYFWAILAPSWSTHRLWFHEGFPRQYNTKPRNRKMR